MTRNVAFLISAILAFVASIAFALLPFGLIVTVAYIFALCAIIAFFMSNIYMLNNQNYPWVVALPRTTFQYLGANVLLSVIFIIWQHLSTSGAPIIAFIFLHIIFLCIFSVFILLLKSSKEIIESKDIEIKYNVETLRLLQADVEALVSKFPQHKKELIQVAEAIRFSDPISNPAVMSQEDEIRRIVHELSALGGNDAPNIPEKCTMLMAIIADRNKRIKMLK